VYFRHRKEASAVGYPIARFRIPEMSYVTEILVAYFPKHGFPNPTLLRAPGDHAYLQSEVQFLPYPGRARPGTGH
jgi:hypothetical protein